jgi:hypothetical protein
MQERQHRSCSPPAGPVFPFVRSFVRGAPRKVPAASFFPTATIKSHISRQLIVCEFEISLISQLKPNNPLRFQSQPIHGAKGWASSARFYIYIPLHILSVYRNFHSFFVHEASPESLKPSMHIWYVMYMYRTEPIRPHLFHSVPAASAPVTKRICRYEKSTILRPRGMTKRERCRAAPQHGQPAQPADRPSIFKLANRAPRRFE